MMLRVRDVLARNLFMPAYVVAGHQGLERPVKWVHVGEIPNIGNYLRGGELVLTTGLGLGTPENRKMFMDGLIGAQAAGLVVELGTYFEELPPDLLEMGNQHDFPLIVFPHSVRFLDLSQEVNSLLLSQHHKILEDLDALSSCLRKVLLNTEGLPSLFGTSYDTLKRPIAYIPRDHGTPMLWGEWPFAVLPYHDEAPHPIFCPHPLPHLRQSITVFGHTVGDVLFLLPSLQVDEYWYLALDRVTTAAAQEVIRADTLEKRKRHEEGVLLEQLLFNQNPAPELIRRFRSRYNYGHHKSFRVMLMESTAREAAGTLAGLLRDLSTLFTTAVMEHEERLATVVMGRTRDIERLPERIRAFFTVHPTLSVPSTGISSTHHPIEDIHQAFGEAHDAATIARLSPPGPAIRCYEKLGAYRWILSTPITELEQRVIHPELDPLLNSSKKHTHGLLETLEALLMLQGSKVDVSQVLGIHRQTLYARIRSLKMLLGDDFMAFERRVALENAILAYRYVRLHKHITIPISSNIRHSM
ncbi:PucR family transcriptional regulator [Sulfobacillus thermosulfidooxidans]|nr:PucR family transcriptional regulator ligand-binding domain-containing protein [Sulfobacillus thermosulfidooxidans]PSR24997.1 MAG: PucR family transcriptional regulator [Sulfobacillus thermosulfidooxidans]